MKNKGQFKPGVSGNPAGRPKGLQERYGRYRAMLEGDVEAVLKMLVKRAVEDEDVTAARVILDRIYPANAEENLQQSEAVKELMSRIEQLEKKK